MQSSDKKNDSDGRYASPVCYAAEFGDGMDEQQQRDLATWRKVERQRQRELRRELTQEQQKQYAQALVDYLDTFLVNRYGDMRNMVLGGYWPIQGELDLVFWFHALYKRGVRVVLPVTETQDAPLVFREWTPDTVMKKDCWHIPIPPPESAQLTPTVLLAPLLGWDVAGYRLGYGGGYFDRTLAVLSPKPFVIGVGLQSSQLPTIFPQAYDMPMDAIVTEVGVYSIQH